MTGRKAPRAERSVRDVGGELATSPVEMASGVRLPSDNPVELPDPLARRLIQAGGAEPAGDKPARRRKKREE